ADDSCIDSCLARIQKTLEASQFDSIGGDYASADANFNLVTYTVENGKIGEPNILYVPEEFKPFQNDLQTQQVVWDYASSLLTVDQLKLITEYVVFTDGESNTLAWVNTKDDLDLSRWQLAVDIVDTEDPVDLTATLIHEFGHLITLNSEQFIPTEYYYSWNQNFATCPQFTIPEGCSNPDSYINLFYQNFWMDIFDEWREMVEKPNAETDEEFDALRAEFYSRHKEQFVREYAATNIREDMAESFMRFVLNPEPAGENPVEQKMLFFYQFPELTALRRQIIQSVCSYTKN
ncbi:MAG: hypothetical protein Q7T89_13600, partial [Anaerolineales bacterium]|nr:hypothetical protein [Anaerolineales bacterium]